VSFLFLQVKVLEALKYLFTENSITEILSFILIRCLNKSYHLLMLIYNYQMHVYSISKCNKDYRLFMARICSARTLQVRSTFFKSFRSFSKSLVRRLVPLSFISYLSVKVAPIFDLQINQRVENKLAFSSTRYNRNYNKNTTTIISSEKSCCESWQVNWINRKPFHSILIHTDKLSQTRLFVGYKNILIKIAKNTNK